MSYELPQDFQYDMYSNGSYLGEKELFKLGKSWFGLFECYGILYLKGNGCQPLRVCSIQDLNDFKSYVLNNKGEVNWDLFQNILISLNSFTKTYSVYRGISHVTTVREFLNKRDSK